MANSKKVTDHLGNEFPSLSAMLSHYNINYSGFKYRINTLKMSLEDALTKPHKDALSTAITCTDHLGNTFPSKAAMCDHWRIPRTLFFRRIRDGWSLEKALTEPLQYTNGIKTTIKDHKNNEFNTIDEMCAHWNISKKQYMENIRNNCTLEQALTTIVILDKTIDHKGNIYKSINEMCRAYNITKTVLRSRIELGWTLKEILENPNKKLNYQKCKDHQGNIFNSQKEMVAYHGVSETTFKQRQSRGWSLEDSLQNMNTHRVIITDHENNTFGSILELCLYWNITMSTFFGRKNKLKWPMKRTLTTITPGRYDKFGPNLTIIKPMPNNYYEVCYKNNIYIWSSQQLYTYYRENILFKQTGIKSMKSIDDNYYEVETEKGICVMPYSEITKRLRAVNNKKG